MGVLSTAIENPIRSLTVIFVIRTFFLLSIAFIATYLFPAWSPLGYDTSSTHVTYYKSGVYIGREPSVSADSLVTEVSRRLVTALTRWDAIYFASIAERGHQWEQEWAFGIGQSFLIQGWRHILSLFSKSDASPSSEILFLSACSCISHYASAVLLYALTAFLFEPAGTTKQASAGTSEKLLAFITAVLHVLSPAGIFLVAPYNESTFSALSFSGYLLYSYALKNATMEKAHSWLDDILILVSGFLFGISCLFRSNGIINGVLFIFELLQLVWTIAFGQNILSNVRSLVICGAAGILVGLPTAWRQYQGWQEYCNMDSRRLWCEQMLPSIYSFVQTQYWGVGFLKYWTPGNIPLFLLAGPMLYVLVKTSLDIVSAQNLTVHHFYSLDLKRTNRDLLFRLAAPQLLLAIMAITNYHVQIITRLSSGLPMWYIVLAAGLIQANSKDSRTNFEKTGSKALSEGGNSEPGTSNIAWCRPALRFMIGYQVVQAVLFGGFLPPA